MLFWLCIIFFAIGLVLLYLGNNYRMFNIDRDKHPILEKLYMSYIYDCYGFILTIIACAGLFISALVMSINHIGADAQVAGNNERYEALCYKLESDKVRDELGLLNKDIVDEIQAWNEDIAKYQELQDNFWVGVYYPNIYDQFEIIELE